MTHHVTRQTGFAGRPPGGNRDYYRHARTTRRDTAPHPAGPHLLAPPRLAAPALGSRPVRRVTREQKTLYEQIEADARRLGA
jgi:hypothetical protein